MALAGVQRNGSGGRGGFFLFWVEASGLGWSLRSSRIREANGISLEGENHHPGFDGWPA